MIHFVLLACLTLTSEGIELKVGIYNHIPDLQEDGLLTYKNMIQNDFESATTHTVNAVVDGSQYDAYGDLNAYLNGDFDILEIDTVGLCSIDDNIIDVTTIGVAMPTDTLATARSAVERDGHYMGYPTLLCGNFIVSFTPGGTQTCPLQTLTDIYCFYQSLTQCQNSFIPPYERVYGGKMNDKDGWYLPFLYLDGYVDLYGSSALDHAMQELLAGSFDKTTCERLRWFIGQCGSKCYDKNATGSYVESFSNLIQDIKNNKTLSMFGFSELSAEVMLGANVSPYAATSWPFGATTHMLQFTGALVVGQKAWSDGTKRSAIREFIEFYISENFRSKISLGEDLSPQRNRYLLQAIESFYTSVVPTDPIYQDIYWELQTSVAAPCVTAQDRETML